MAWQAWFAPYTPLLHFTQVPAKKTEGKRGQKQGLGARTPGNAVNGGHCDHPGCRAKAFCKKQTAEHGTKPSLCSAAAPRVGLPLRDLIVLEILSHAVVSRASLLWGTASSGVIGKGRSELGREPRQAGKRWKVTPRAGSPALVSQLCL